MYAVNSVWSDNLSPIGGDTAVHMSRDVSLTVWNDAAVAVGDVSAIGRAEPTVSRDGVCDIGWVIPAVSTQECVRCESSGFSWWAGEAMSEKCHPCPVGATCADGGSTVISTTGWYVPSMRWHAAVLDFR